MFVFDRKPRAHVAPPQQAASRRRRRRLADVELLRSPHEYAGDAAEGGLDVAEEALAEQGPGVPLSPELRRDMEQRFGADFSHVRVHTEPAAGKAARAIGARAFTVGQHVFFAPGESPLAATTAPRLLIHELAHVVQAQQGRIPVPPAGPRISRRSDALEQEAERVTDAVTARRPPAVASGHERTATTTQIPLNGARVMRWGKEPLVTEANGFKLEQTPSKGDATLSLNGEILALLHWDPKEGREIHSMAFGRGSKGSNLLNGNVTTFEISILADFEIDAVIDGAAEQRLTSWTIHGTTEFTHHLDFPGQVHYRVVDGSTQTVPSPAKFGYRYTPINGEELKPKLPPTPIDAGKDPFTPPEKKPAPQPKVWSFKDPDSYDKFAASHPDTKWAEIKTADGQFVAWALTVEAVTRMADKVRAKRDDFEFLSGYPSGHVVGVHRAGRKLTAVTDLADMYYRSIELALSGTDGALPECEVDKMEGGKFSRQGLGHSQALVRWKEIENADANPLTPLVPDDPSKKVILLSNAIDFAALRVVGDNGLQTITPADFKNTARRSELKGGFTNFDPLGDDLSSSLPTDLSYPDITRTLKTLLRRKRDIVGGREPPAELDGINGRIEQLKQQLQAQGVNLDDDHLIDALDAGRDMRQIGGHLVANPGPPYFFSERLTFQPVFDYLPPTAKMKIGWRWQAQGKEYQFFETQDLSPARQLILDDFFWNFVSPDIERANGIEVIAYVYLDDAKTPAATLKSGWIDFGAGRAMPEVLTISGDKVVVQGARKTYRIAEWVPGKDYAVDWSAAGVAAGQSMPVYEHRFDNVGTERIVARIYSLDETGWPRGRHFKRDVTLDVQVEDPQAAGEKLVGEMKKNGQPALAKVDESLDASIGELDKHVHAGGGQQSYWEKRLEAQKKRRDKLHELGPNAKTTKDLPADPTVLDDALTYSGPIAASLVLPAAGGAQPLSIYLTVKKDGSRWSARLLDMTSSDVWKFDGDGTTPLEAYVAAFNEWKSNNPYPKEGRVAYGFKPPGWTLDAGFTTWRVGKMVKDWVDGILLIGGLVVAGLLLAAPEATVTKALGLILLAATVTRASVQIAENISLGMSVLDSRNIVEAVTIVVAFTGVSGTLLRQAGIAAARPLVYRIGSWTVMASLAADAGTLVYASAQAVSQLQAVRGDPTLSEDERSLQTLQLISTMLAQGAMFIVANKDMFKGGLKHSDFFATDPKVTGDNMRSLAPGETPKLDTGSRLDVAAELRKAGESPDRLKAGQLTDRALIDRYSALPWLNESLTKGEVEQLLNRLDTTTLKSLSDVPANKAKGAIDAIANDAVVNDLATHLDGAKLTSLVDLVGGKQVGELHGAFGAEGTAKLLTDVGADTAGRLIKPPAGTTAGGLKQLHDQLGPQALKNLGSAASGKAHTGSELVALVKQHGAEQVKWAGTDLHGAEAGELLSALSSAAIDRLRNVDSRQAKGLLTTLGSATLEKAVPVADGEQLQLMRESFGDQGFKDVVAQQLAVKTAGGKLPGFASNLEANAAKSAANAAPLGSGSRESVIVDSNSFIGVEKLVQGVPWADLTPNRQSAINKIRKRNGAPPLTADPPGRDLVSILGKDTDLRISSATAAENAPVPGLKTEGIPIQGSRNDAAYNDVVKAMTTEPMVGGNKGVMDRLDVADAFFAKTAGDAPVYVTGDDKVMKGLTKFSSEATAKIAEIDKAAKLALKAKKTPTESTAVKDILLKHFEDGFKVEIPDSTGKVHKLTVVPAG